MSVPSITTATTTTHDSQQGYRNARYMEEYCDIVEEVLNNNSFGQREDNGATRKLLSSSPSPMTTLTSCTNNDDGQHVHQNLHSMFTYDERLVKAILDNDERLNNEVDELFDLESLFK